MYIDTHVHLSHKSYDSSFPYVDTNADGGFERIASGTRKILLEEAGVRGIHACIEPGIDISSNERLLRLCEQYPAAVFAAVGVHPKCAPGTEWSAGRKLEEYAEDPAVVAIGELGLDYFWEKTPAGRLKQHIWFIRQLLLADRKELPLILHIRDADRHALRILRVFRHKLHGGVCHCFCGDADTARQYIRLGLTLGIGGALLQGTEISGRLEQVIREVPLEHLLLETDGPYMKPAAPAGLSRKKWRSARNTSLIIPAVAARIAALKGLPIEEVERATTQNALRVFPRLYAALSELTAGAQA